MSDEQKKQTVIPSPAQEPDGSTRGKLDEESLSDTHKHPASAGVVVGKVKHGLFHKECKNCEKLKGECADYKSGWQRALADYKNLQKETTERRAEWARYSEQQILEEFIPVYEHLKLAYGLRTTDYSPEQQKWVDGIKYIMKQFSDILKAHGVEEIKTVGEQFDPKLHEAAGHEEAEGKAEGEIIKEISGGYKMGGRVIRAAKVIVVK